MNLRSLLAVLLVAALAVPAAAAEPELPGWYFDADLAGVWTAGNSESNALGAAAKLQRLVDQWHFTFKGSASQTQTTKVTRTASGSVDDFTVNEDRERETASEFFNATAIAAYDVSEHFFVLGGADWTRNRPAGIDSRTLLALGAGNTWWATDETTLRTFYNGTYTFQDDVVTNPFTAKDFPGLQAGYTLERQLSVSTTFKSDLVADLNLDNTDDIRVDWYNALPVSINSRLELKPSLRLLWRNDPALQELPLVDGGGVPTGDTIVTPLDEIDTIFTLALVIKFHPDQED